MSRPRTYTGKTLRKAVKRYFDSITREVELTEKIPTDRKDDKGHTIYETRKIKNSLGEVAKVTEYLVPPTIGGLCRYLGIVASTWSRWTDKKKYPEFAQIIEETMDRLLTWRKEQVVTRKDVKGLIWDMETNYGCGKQEKPDDDRPSGVILMPQVNELTPPTEEGAMPDG